MTTMTIGERLRQIRLSLDPAGVAKEVPTSAMDRAAFGVDSRHRWMRLEQATESDALSNRQIEACLRHLATQSLDVPAGAAGCSVAVGCCGPETLCPLASRSCPRAALSRVRLPSAASRRP